jgi:hypothetical protein
VRHTHHEHAACGVWLKSHVYRYVAVIVDTI